MSYDLTKKATVGQIKTMAQRVETKKADKATTLAGYGITDGMTSSQVESAITGKGYQTSAQVESAIAAKGYQTSDQVEGAITAKGYQTASDVAAAVAAADHLDRVIKDSTSDIDLNATDAGKHIYMVPKTSGEGGDQYDEYMVISGALEKVGNWAVDLSGYVARSEIATDAEFTEMLNEVFGEPSA